MLRYFLSLKQSRQQQKAFLNLLNIIGLAIGVAVFMFIVQYAQYEWSYDKFHEEGGRIYRVNFIRERPGQDPFISAASFPALGPAIEREYEEVESACRVVPVWGLKGLIVWEERSVESEFINYADANLFEFFSFKLIQGDPKTALTDQHTVVLSNSKASALFGDADPIGQRIEMQTRDGRYFFEVRGVFDDSMPTHITTDVFLSWTSLYAIPNVDRDRIENNWTWTQYPVYVKLLPSVTPENLIVKFPLLIDKYLPDRPGKDLISFDLQSLESIHLNSHLYRELDQNGDAQVVNTLLIIGFLVLIIAWINYVNLYTARVGDHLKVVGIRKTLGASRSSLFLRFMKEAMFFSLLAIVVATGILYLVKPFIIQTTGLVLPSEELLSTKDIAVMVVLWFVTSLFCGIYPATLISRIDPLKALNQKGSNSSSGQMRRALVIFQFMASSLLVGSTLIIQQQIQHMSALDLGINKENVLAIDTYLYDNGEREHQRNLKLFKNVLSGYGTAQQVAYASSVIGEEAAFSSSSDVLGRSLGETGARIVDIHVVGPDYLNLIDATLLAGRHFEFESDSVNIIINRKAMEFYGFESPISSVGQQIVFPVAQDTLRIIGVVEDYIQESTKAKIDPAIFRNNHWELSKVVARVSDQDLQEFLDFARAEHAEIFPNTPFNFKLIDEILVENNQAENNFASLFNLFSFLTIFIALLGILALSYFMANKRKKEVCVRKVLGSTRLSIIGLVFKDFAKLVLLGNLVAIPVMYLVANEWLGQFAYRIDFNWVVPLLALGISLFLAFSFSYFNLWQLARTNPAQVLRNE